MTPEEREAALPKEIAIEIAGTSVRLLPSLKADTPGALEVVVKDITSKDEIALEARTSIEHRYWFTQDLWQKETLKERFRIELGEHAVDIFAFGESLTEEQQKLITDTLARFYGMLRDKSMWNLTSIQIRPMTEINTKSGEPFRGMEHPEEHRLEIYTAGLETSPYRGGELPCSELEGTLVHEITHVTLEKALAQAWSAEDLGWRFTKDVLIELPGGDRASFYNEHPENCVTTYAALQQDDDRAESVVAYLFAPEKLNEQRRNILDRFFDRTQDTVSPVMTDLPPTFPELPSELSINVIPKKSNPFGAITILETTKIPVVDLQTFRRTKGISER